jgi:hypothetical protein
MHDHPPDTRIALERAARDVLGRSYDRDHGPPPERFSAERALTITGVPGGYQHATHVVFAICGSPTRGLAMVQILCDPQWGKDLWTHRKLRIQDVDTLLRFLRFVAECSERHLPRHYSWSSHDHPA